MDKIEISKSDENSINNFSKLREATADKIPNEVLARLVEEVRNEEVLANHSYNRFHNRHNR